MAVLTHVNNDVVRIKNDVDAVSDQINFVASAESVGDFIDIWSDGNKWYVWGIGNASGSITATDPS